MVCSRAITLPEWGKVTGDSGSFWNSRKEAISIRTPPSSRFQSFLLMPCSASSVWLRFATACLSPLRITRFADSDSSRLSHCLASARDRATRPYGCPSGYRGSCSFQVSKPLKSALDMGAHFLQKAPIPANRSSRGEARKRPRRARSTGFSGSAASSRGPGRHCREGQRRCLR